MSKLGNAPIPTIVHPKNKSGIIYGSFLLDQDLISRILNRVKSIYGENLETIFELELYDCIIQKVNSDKFIETLPFTSLSQITEFKITVKGDNLSGMSINFDFKSNYVYISVENTENPFHAFEIIKKEITSYRPWYHHVYDPSVNMWLYISLNGFSLIYSAAMLTIFSKYNTILLSSVMIFTATFYYVFWIIRKILFSPSVVMFGPIRSREENIAKIRMGVGKFLTAVALAVLIYKLTH